MKREEDDHQMSYEQMFDCNDAIEPYRCVECPVFQTNCLAYLTQHIKSGHRHETNEKVVYKCLRCYFSTYSSCVLLKHSFSRDCATSDINETKNRFVSFRSNILEQQSSFNVKEELPSNGLQKTDQSKDNQYFKCEQCPSQFTYKQNLNRHLLASHSKSDQSEDNQDFKCEQCPSRFTYKHNLKRHLSIYHSGDAEWFKCDHCPSKFREKYNHKKHVLLHSKTEDVDWLECAQCSYRCKQKAHLKSHMTLHIKPEDIQWFKCEHCCSKFKRKFSLNHHIKYVHAKVDEIQWFECEHCLKIFKASKSLKRHLVLFHGDMANGADPGVNSIKKNL